LGKSPQFFAVPEPALQRTAFAAFHFRRVQQVIKGQGAANKLIATRK
jgi:hypothetical protein